MNKRGVLTLVFDDGYKDVYEQVVPLLNFYKVKAVFAIPLAPERNKVSGHAVKDVASWKAIAKRDGHELAGHGISHNSFTGMPESQLDEELKSSCEGLDARTLVYPGGAYNNHVISATKKYFNSARTVKFGLESIPPKKPFELKTIDYTKKNFNLFKANAYAVKAYMQNKWLIETFHMVSSKHSSLKHFIYLNDLDAHLDFVTSLPIAIKTISQVIK
jgi:peptidoglycan/xylan/chitin deacetylase (PgdA/CDA1 family)